MANNACLAQAKLETHALETEYALMVLMALEYVGVRRVLLELLVKAV